LRGTSWSTCGAGAPGATACTTPSTTWTNSCWQPNPTTAEHGRDLETLFDALPQAQRQAIELTKLGGLSVAEAAARTGASESAIKVQVHRGLKRLAALVRADPFAEPPGKVRQQPGPLEPGMSRPVHQRSK
jgi:DNA-directed RNA polymerase specialized sigma24 family protein